MRPSQIATENPERSIVAMIFGAVSGALVGAVVAVNIVIFSGVEDGYETSPRQLVDQHPTLAIAVLLAFLGCVSAGVVIARR